jgi:hypothetical protein
LVSDFEDFTRLTLLRSDTRDEVRTYVYSVSNCLPALKEEGKWNFPLKSRNDHANLTVDGRREAQLQIESELARGELSKFPDSPPDQDVSPEPQWGEVVDPH